MTTLEWARLSNDAFNVALFSYLAAMVGYFAYLAFRRERSGRSPAPWRSWAWGRTSSRSSPAGSRPHRVPWGNMYEYSTLLAFLVVLGYLVIVEGVYKMRTLGGFALMFSVLTMAMAVSFLYVGPGPLVPALNSYWIKIHVRPRSGARRSSRSAGIVTILYLVQDRRERRRIDGAPRRRTRRRSWAARSTWTLRTTWWATPVPTRPASAERRRAARHAAGGRHARPARLPDHRVRVPDLDLRA